MAKSKIKKVIKFFGECLKKSNLRVSKIIIFGSHAMGKASKESDIDIVVISEDFRKKDIFKRVNLIKDAEIATIKKFMIPLDIIMLTPEEFKSETSLIADYARNGEVVYAT